MRKEELTELVTWFVGLSLSDFLKCSIAKISKKNTYQSYLFWYYFALNKGERQ